MAFNLRSGNKSSFKSMGSSPAKQKVKKGQGKLIKGQGELKKQTNSWKSTEGQDQDKIFNSKGEHVGDWIDGKKVMKPTKGMSKELSDITPAPMKHVKPPKTKSPVKQVGQGFGAMTVESDRDTKALDAYRSAATIEKRHRKNTMERAEGERLAEGVDTSISKEKAEQRRHMSAHRDPKTGDWKA